MSEYIFDVPDSNQPIAGESAIYYPDERDEPMVVGEKIVRCRDCKHHHEGMCMLTDGMGDFKRWLVDDDDYCSDGEMAVGA